MRIEHPATIHHPELVREEIVPAETVDSWAAQGWLPGPFPHADGRPPRNGPGSGLEAWQVYARARGIAITDDASRTDIFALVDQLDQAATTVTVDPPVDGPTIDADPGADPAPVGADPNPEEGGNHES